jgi:hypothetical protein
MVDSYRYEQNDIICYPLSRCRRVHGTPTLTLSNFRPTMGRKVNRNQVWLFALWM